jgi:hypothetical protein
MMGVRAPAPRQGILRGSDWEASLVGVRGYVCLTGPEHGLSQRHQRSTLILLHPVLTVGFTSLGSLTCLLACLCQRLATHPR